MGANYYAHKGDDIIHIGRENETLKFTFHAAKGMNSWVEWQKFLRQPDVIIVDERKWAIPYDKFEEIVNKSRVHPETYYNYVARYEPPGTSDWEGLSRDAEGFCFIEGRFS